MGPSKGGQSTKNVILKQTKEVNFQLLHLSILREYLEFDFLAHVPEEERDVERIIDDFVLLTFLVGNDFLPHLPTLDIGEHAFHLLFDIYRKLQPTWKTIHTEGDLEYLTKDGVIYNFEGFEALLAEIGSMEHNILEERENLQLTVTKKRINTAKRFGRELPDGLKTTEELSKEEEEAQERYAQAIHIAIANGEMTLEEAQQNNAIGTGRLMNHNGEEGKIEQRDEQGHGDNQMKTESSTTSTKKDYRGRY